MSQSLSEDLASFSEQLRFWLDPAARAAGALLESPRLGDAGFDLRASSPMVVEAGLQALVSTGLYCAIPVGWVGFIKDRSSMALRGFHTHAGVIDASYRGEVKILIANRSGEDLCIRAGDKIAQMVIIPHLAGAQEVGSLQELGDSVRGQKGFGSTGR